MGGCRGRRSRWPIFFSKGTSREAEATERQMRMLSYSRSSFERVGHAVGKRYVEQAPAIERALIDEDVPDEARSISVSLDRVSVPMEEPRPRPTGRPRKGAAKNPISRVYRMGYVGTVCLHDKDGNAIRILRYGTMPGGDPERLCVGLADDVLQLLAKRPRLRLSLLCDGAPEMWNLLGAQFDRATFGQRRIYSLLDFWHTVEKLAAAAKVIDPATAASMRARWKLRLLNAGTARSEILRELRASGAEHSKLGEDEPVHDAIAYLENNAGRMDYARARTLGLPIGSGNVEATCKSLMNLRMNRSGARRKIDTGEHIIQLRALALSDRWDAAMALALAPPKPRIRRAALTAQFRSHTLCDSVQSLRRPLPRGSNHAARGSVCMPAPTVRVADGFRPHSACLAPIGRRNDSFVDRLHVILRVKNEGGFQEGNQSRRDLTIKAQLRLFYS